MSMMKKFAGVIIIFFSVFQVLHSQSLVTEKNDSATFPLITSSQIASIYIDQNDDWLVRKVASLLQNDIELDYDFGFNPERDADLIANNFTEVFEGDEVVLERFIKMNSLLSGN